MLKPYWRLLVLSLWFPMHVALYVLAAGVPCILATVASAHAFFTCRICAHEGRPVRTCQYKATQKSNGHRCATPALARISLYLSLLTRNGCVANWKGSWMASSSPNFTMSVWRIGFNIVVRCVVWFKSIPSRKSRYAEWCMILLHPRTNMRIPCHFLQCYKCEYQQNRANMNSSCYHLGSSCNPRRRRFLTHRSATYAACHSVKKITKIKKHVGRPVPPAPAVLLTAAQACADLKTCHNASVDMSLNQLTRDVIDNTGKHFQTNCLEKLNCSLAFGQLRSCIRPKCETAWWTQSVLFADLVPKILHWHTSILLSVSSCQNLMCDLANNAHINISAAHLPTTSFNCSGPNLGSNKLSIKWAASCHMVVKAPPHKWYAL